MVRAAVTRARRYLCAVAEEPHLAVGEVAQIVAVVAVGGANARVLVLTTPTPTPFMTTAKHEPDRAAAEEWR